MKNLLSVFFFICLYLSAGAQEPLDKKADSLSKAGKYKEAAAIWTSLLQSKGPKVDWLTGRAYALIQTGDVAGAVADYKKATTLDSNCSKCHGNLLLLFTESGQLQKALPHANAYIRLQPDHSMGYVKRGEIYSQTGNTIAALADLDKGLQLEPGSPYIFLWRSITRLNAGDNKGALEDINESLRIKPDVEYAWFVKGKCLIRLGAYDSAVVSIQTALRKNNTMPEYFTYAGIAFHMQGKTGEAIRYLDRSLQLDSSQYLAWQYHGYANYARGQFSSACNDKQKAIALLQQQAPGDPAFLGLMKEFDEYCNELYPSFYRHTGDVLFDLLRFDLAEKAFAAGLNNFKNDATLLEGVARCQLAQGRDTVAIIGFHAALKNAGSINYGQLLSPSFQDTGSARINFISELYNSMSYAQVRLARFDSAVFYSSAAIGLLQRSAHPVLANKRAAYLSKRANLYVATGNMKAAIADNDDALKLNPNDAEAWVTQAQLLLNQQLLQRTADEKIGVQKDSLRQSLTIQTKPLQGWNKTDVEKAYDACGKAIALDPKRAWAWYLHAQAGILLDKADWCASLKKARDLGLPVKVEGEKECK